MRRALTSLTAMALLLAAASDVQAQASNLAQAREAMGRAAFGEAVGIYDAALAGEAFAGASPQELRVVIEERAIARHAARDTAGAEQDLVALLSLEPGHELGQTAPPALHRAIERLRAEVPQALRLEASAEAVEGGALLHARAIGDIASIVREVRIGWRLSGGEFDVASGEETRVSAPPGEVEWYAEAVGPGGAVLARYDAEATGGPAALPPVTLAPEAPGAEGGGDDSVAIGVGVGVGLAVALGVAAGLLVFFLTPEPNTALSAPMERAP